METKAYDRADGIRTRPIEDGPHIIPLVIKRKNCKSTTSSSSSRSPSPKRTSGHSFSSDDSKGLNDDQSHQASSQGISRTKKRHLRHRQSSGSSSSDGSQNVRRDKDIERKQKLPCSWDSLVPIRVKRNIEGGVKPSDSPELKNEIPETRLNQLSSERDRSISVDRSSSSSGERIAPAKPNTGNIRSNSIEKKNSGPKGPVENAGKKSSDVISSKASNANSRSPKEASRRNDTKKQETSADRKSCKSKRSRSRSRSRTSSKHRRREISPRRDRRRSRERHHRDRSPRRRSPVTKSRYSRSRSHGRRSRSRGHRRRSSRSRSFERRRYRRDRSSSRDRYRKRRRSPSSSRSRSRGRLSHDRLKGKLGTSVAKLGSLPLSTTGGTMTPQMALQQTMAAMSAKAQALTGIELPKYYNPAAVNPLKYAEQVQKRKLLWQTKKEPTQEQQPPKSIWDKLTFTQDDDGKMTQKFRKLMGIKGEGETSENETKEVAAAEGSSDVAALRKQEELFRNLDQQYEMARMSTHTHRGVGLGYSAQAIFPPMQKP